MKGLKNFFENWPALISIILNIFLWSSFIYAFNQEKYIVLLVTLFILVLTRWILEKGVGLTKGKRVLIFSSYLLMSLVPIFQFNSLIK